MHAIAGLNIDQIRFTVHALCGCNNADLAELFLSTIVIFDTTLSLLLKEMFSTRKHILYWTVLAKSPSWELYLYRLNSMAFKQIRKTLCRNPRDYVILENSESMLRHAELIGADLDELAVFLDQINECASHLKAIYVYLNSFGASVITGRVDRCDSLDSELGKGRIVQ